MSIPEDAQTAPKQIGLSSTNVLILEKVELGSARAITGIVCSTPVDAVDDH